MTQYPTSTPQQSRPQIDQEGPGPIGYLALVLAWAVPGLGHIVLGQRARGIIFALTVHGLFAAGMLIGGIRAINPVDQPIWTYTQFLAGWPMVVSNRIENQSRDEILRLTLPNSLYDVNRPNVADDQMIPARIQYGKEYIALHPLFAYHPKVQDIGAVYCGIAGMLNLLVMFDVLLRITGSIREDPAAAQKKKRAAQAAVANAGDRQASEGVQ